MEDIIDLDYLAGLDNALESKEKIQERLVRDRHTYSRMENKGLSDCAVLLLWLKARRKEFTKENSKRKTILLPGSFFSGLYTFMVYAMLAAGGLSGICLAYSFLAYHGTRPINVAVFIVLFIVLQAIFVGFTLVLLIRRRLDKRGRTSVAQTLLSAFFFETLPMLLKKADWAFLNKSFETIDYTSSLFRVKQKEYKGLFFWPFFILTSLFGFSFSAGALGGTFFRVIVSDMAFGWQSTLMATSQKVHELVSFMALPWSWFMPAHLAHPSLEQIDGSRIVLKDGISVLATGDLVSWWPFLCLGILVYAVIPRCFLLVVGMVAKQRVLAQFDFEKSAFRQLLARMTSPRLDIEASKVPVSLAKKSRPLMSRAIMAEEPVVEKGDSAPKLPAGAESSVEACVEIGTTVILAAKNVYADPVLDTIARQIKATLFYDVKTVIGIDLDFDGDADRFRDIPPGISDPVILIQEVWQPPIRGLLYYITQVKAALPEKRPLWIFLTGDAGQEDLCVQADDLNFEIWKKAVFKLEDPGITVKRFF